MNATTENQNFVIPLIEEDVNYEVVKDTSIFRNVIGQSEACKKLNFYVDSHSNEMPIPTMLFTGSHGLGKTYLARMVADALGRELIEINCGSFGDTKISEKFIEEVLFNQVMGNTPKTLLLDESHKLPQKITTMLLTLLNPNRENVNYYTYKNWIIKFNMAKINVIFATTDAHKMFDPLVDRCKEIYFHSYDRDELLGILDFYLPNVKLACNEDDISYACRGRGRDTFTLSQDIRRYCSLRKKSVITDLEWKEFKDIFDIHAYGLTSKEIELLEMLKDGNPISCRNLAIKMMVNEHNVESELEVRLRELGFIDNVSGGRKITSEGLKCLQEIKG